jgi:hypothetical protein
VWLGGGVGSLADAPFFAYLMRSGHIRPPHIPPSAIPIGPLRVRRIQRSTGPPTAIAELRFTLPDVSPGTHYVEFCNQPRTTTGFGDLTWGRFEVVSSLDQVAIYRLRQRVDVLRAKLAHAERESIRQDQRARRDLDSLEQISAVTASQVGVLRERVAELEARSSGDGGWMEWVAAALGALFIGVLLGRWRRRAEERAYRLPERAHLPETIEPPESEKKLEPVGR